MYVRTSRGLALCLCAVVSLGAARPAKAAALLTGDDREIEVEASVSEGGAGHTVGPSLLTPNFGDPFTPFLETGLLVSSPSGDAEASAMSIQSSSFDTVPGFSWVSATGSANAFGRVDAFATIADAQSSADSIFDITFTVDTPQQWSIIATIDDEGSGSTGRVRLRQVGGGVNEFLLQGTGQLSASASGTLDPGITYQLRGEARVAGFASSFGSSFFNKDAAFSLEFNIVPEPATGLLALVCGPLLLRRRARR